VTSENAFLLLREWSLFMGGGVGKWGGGGRILPLKIEGVKKVLTQRKGVVKNVFELKYHV
jgi:hypothetical protein